MAGKEMKRKRKSRRERGRDEKARKEMKIEMKGRRERWEEQRMKRGK